MGNLGPLEIGIIALVIILLFGAPKLPQMARSLGQSMRIFKSETKAGAQSGSNEEDSETESSGQAQQPYRQLPANQEQSQQAQDAVEQPVQETPHRERS